MTEQAQAVQEFTDEALKIAEDEFNMTPEELAYNKVLIQRLAKELEKREVELKQKRRIKAARRAANKTARKQRRVNRK
ncbi:hypothetical protein XaC1_390 [Xanthomonas phage XaC1]|nr:hypothetical protein XaC1_390 [Xanthomonas phage XaC1]